MNGARYEVTITRGHAWCLFELRGSVEPILSALRLPQPIEPNRRAARGAGMAVARIGPNRWFVRASAAEEGRLSAILAAAIDQIANADMALVTDQFEAFHLVGPGAGDILSQGTALDVAPATFAGDAMTATEMFGASILLERSEDPTGGFVLYIERSFGDWLERWLHAAAGIPSLTQPGNRVTDEKRRRSL